MLKILLALLVAGGSATVVGIGGNPTTKTKGEQTQQGTGNQAGG